MEEFKFEIVKKLGILSESENGWRKEVNMVSWNERPARLDIREWAPDGQKMRKGITFSEKEIVELKTVLSEVVTEELSF